MAVENLKGNTDLSIKSGSLKQFSPIASATTLLNEAVYYIDASSPTNWGSLGYVYLNGISGNALSVSDETSLDITGDLDLRVKVAMDDWTPGATSILLSKRDGASTQYSWSFYVTTAGLLTLSWTADGSTEVRAAVSSVAPTITDGSTLWVRATLDVDNGASGNDVIFYTSTDGTTWTQLGTTRTAAGTTSIYAGTAPVRIGVQYSGLNSGPTAGNFYRAQILNGIGGTTVLDVNIATDFLASNEDSFTATSGQTVTVNGVDTIANKGTAGSLLPTTLGSSTAADSNDPKFLSHTGTNYVYLPGVASNYLSVPDSNELDITGDIDLRAYVAMDDWTPGGSREIIAKYTTTGNQRSYRLGLTSTGNLILYWTTDGSAAANFATSSVAIASEDGSASWVRATLDVDNGASGNDVKFYTSTDGISWTQLGTTITTAGTTSIYSGTAVVEMGTVGAGSTNPTAMKVFRGQIFNGIDGTKVLDIDTSVITAGSATSFTAVTGQTVTINRSTSGRKTVAVTQPTWLFGTDDYMEVNNRYMSSGTYLYLPGVASNNCTSPDSAALDITGDLDIRVKIALDDWTPSVSNALVAKYGTTGQRSYLLQIDQPSGAPSLTWSTDGTTLTAQSASVAPTVLDGSTLWIRVTLDVDNGAGGYDVKFYTSSDGTTWTQLGITKTGASTTSVFAGTSQLEIGNWSAANGPCRGKYYRAQIRNGIDGTVVFDANFETSITSLLQTSFTESSANAATVTINRSGSAFRSAGITQAGYLYPGATNTFKVSSVDYLNFGASDSFTVLAVFRDWHWDSSPYIAKTASFATGTDKGYDIYTITTPALRGAIKDGTVGLISNVNVGTKGGLTTGTLVRNTGTDSLSVYVNTTASSPLTDTTTASLETIETLKLGRIGASYAATELVAAAVWRRRLLAPEIGAIYEYFNARD